MYIYIYTKYNVGFLQLGYLEDIFIFRGCARPYVHM